MEIDITRGYDRVAEIINGRASRNLALAVSRNFMDATVLNKDERAFDHAGRS
jgi:hypothetical protein